MKKLSTLVLILFGVVAVLGACTRESKQNLGILNTAPDESKVSTRQPLTVPPDYSLRPVVSAASAADME